MAKIAPRKIALIGMMGSGKSTLAELYAAKHGISAYDTDKVFTRRYGDISAYFEAHGEQAFRNIETELLIDAANSDYGIIACGGGAVLSKRGMAAIRSTCDIVYLNAPISVLRERIENSDRPLKRDIERLVTERAPLYERYADYTLNEGGEDVMSELEKLISTPRKNRYDILLCDADDTVLDFKAAMRQAIINSARAVGITRSDDEIVCAYDTINKAAWEKLERGEITRAELDIQRFETLRDRFNGRFDPAEMSEIYLLEMRKTRFVIDGAIEFLNSVKAKGIKVYIVTNGMLRMAKERLKALDGAVDGSFISEEIGYDKPDIRFFETVHEAIGKPNKNRILIFGDSATSDIAGGAAFGIDTCLFDRSGKTEVESDYKASDYSQVLDII